MSGAPGAAPVWAIVVAAGSGVRFGRAKQFLPLDGKRVIDLAVEHSAAACARVVLVLPAGVSWDGVPVAATVTGGATRSESVRAGLAAVPDEVDAVVVHDAARPLASPALFRAVIEALRTGVDAAIPALPVADTLKHVRDGRVEATLDRDGVVAVQTPQAFRTAALRAAHRSGASATDDAALVEAAGGNVVVVPGEPANLKITTPADLAVAAALWRARRSDRPGVS